MTESSPPVGSVDPESGELSEEDRADIRAALSSEEPLERQHGVRTCTMLLGESVEPVRPLVDDLAPLLEDQRTVVARHAGTALLAVGCEHPEDLVNAVPEILSLATREDNEMKLLGANLLATSVLERPEAAADDVHRLFPHLRQFSGAFEAGGAADMVDDAQTRQSIVEYEQENHRKKLQAFGTFANVLVAVADAEPEALFDHVDILVALTDQDDAVIAGCAIDAIGTIARADPDVAAPAFEGVRTCLERDDERIQARTVRALGFLGDDRAVDPLFALAEETDDEDVRRLAIETAEFLAEE